jgi:Arc/MetJ-type ribon-helix-helix transcriptional regulator
MKVSVSLPDDDVEFLDAYATATGTSRSAVLHRAVRLLRASELGPSYEEAFSAWDSTGAAADWEITTADGLRPDAPR